MCASSVLACIELVELGLKGLGVRGEGYGDGEDGVVGEVL